MQLLPLVRVSASTSSNSITSRDFELVMMKTIMVKLPKVTVTIKAVTCHQLWIVPLCFVLEKHYFILKESTKNCIHSCVGGQQQVYQSHSL